MLGVVFAKSWRYDPLTGYHDNYYIAMIWHFGGELLMENCLYFGLGAAALIYGVHLTTKNNKK